MLTSAFQHSPLLSCKLVTNFVQLYNHILQLIEPGSYCGSSAQVLFSLILVKNGDI